jgi:hypothetical protein
VPLIQGRVEHSFGRTLRLDFFGPDREMTRALRVLSLLLLKSLTSIFVRFIPFVTSACWPLAFAMLFFTWAMLAFISSAAPMR